MAPFSYAKKYIYTYILIILRRELTILLMGFQQTFRLHTRYFGNIRNIQDKNKSGLPGSQIQNF